MSSENGKSVTRRIIAILFCTCSVAVLTYLGLKGSETALTALIAMSGTVTGFYFGVRSNGL